MKVTPSGSFFVSPSGFCIAHVRFQGKQTCLSHCEMLHALDKFFGGFAQVSFARLRFSHSAFSIGFDSVDARLRTSVAKCLYCSARLITELRWLNPPSYAQHRNLHSVPVELPGRGVCEKILK